jgi:uncharacterized phiE125 gp8 family phage protein
VIRAKVVAEPANEPITLAECYLQCRVEAIDSDGHPDDDLLLAYAKAAREYCENFTGLSLALKDYEVRMNEFPDPLELPHPPFVALLNGITVSDTVSDNAIDEDTYVVDDYTDSIVTISPVTTWPELSEGNTVRIRYRAGYGDESEAAGQLPSPIKAAMLLVLGHLYANREATNAQSISTLPLGVESLLRPYRVLIGFA